MAYNKARKRGDRWSFVLERERDPATGKRRQKWVSGYGTKDEAKKALRASLKVIDDGQYPFPHEVTVGAFVVQRWLPELEPQSGLRARTIENHRQLWCDQCAPAHRCDASGPSPRTPDFDADIDLLRLPERIWAVLDGGALDLAIFRDVLSATDDFKPSTKIGKWSRNSRHSRIE